MRIKHQEPATEELHLGAAPRDKRRARPGRRWWLIAAVAVLAGSLSGIGVSYLARPSNPSATSNQVITSSGGSFAKGTGLPAPSWSLANLRSPSASVSLAQFSGHPVVVNFWASWCPPCRKEMPALAATAGRLAGKVAFVGVDVSDQRGAALSFAAKTGVNYPLAYDPNASAAGRYGVYGLPTTFFVSAQGKILGRQTGGMTASRLSQLIKQTFAIPNSTSRR